MTPQEIVSLLFKPVDQARVEKAKGLALRSRIDWARVLDAMTEEQRKQVTDAQ